MFNTFIKDCYEDENAYIKEFKHFIEIVQNTKLKDSTIDDSSTNNEKESTLKSSNSTELFVKDSESAYEKRYKLKALIFKQNMEIQNLISVFKNDSDNEESFDELVSTSAVRITSLDQSMALFKKQGEEYKSSTDIKIEVEESSSKNPIQNS